MFLNRYLAASVLLLLVSACRHKKDVAKTKAKSDPKKEVVKREKEEVKDPDFNPVKEKLGVTNKEIRESKLYRYINDWYGVPYKYGGCQKTGVDCSCFTSNLYETVYGKKLARTAGDIQKECDKVSTEKLKQGDLVFFITNGKNISHVGVYVKDNKFVHASTSKGVMISDLSETYYKKTFSSAGRLKHSS